MTNGNGTKLVALNARTCNRLCVRDGNCVILYWTYDAVNTSPCLRDNNCGAILYWFQFYAYHVFKRQSTVQYERPPRGTVVTSDPRIHYNVTERHFAQKFFQWEPMDPPGSHTPIRKNFFTALT
jgi:hypothetical protein